MLLELARPVALLLCILSLYAVFHTAFLIPATDLEQTIWNSLELLALAAGISLVSGLLFLEPIPGEPPASTRLVTTLPMRLFCWTTVAILALFIAAWYLGSQCPAACRNF